MFNEMNSLIAKIQLPETQAINEGILEDKDDEFESLSINLEIKNQPIKDFNEKKDLELANALEEALTLFIPPIDKMAFHTALPIINENDDREQTPCQSCSQGMDDRFDDFDEKKISSIFHKAFIVGYKVHKRKLSLPPKIIQDLKDH